MSMCACLQQLQSFRLVLNYSCFVIVTMENLPFACMLYLLLLLLTTLIRIVEDPEQKLLLPLKRTEKSPPFLLSPSPHNHTLSFFSVPFFFFLPVSPAPVQV